MKYNKKDEEQTKTMTFHSKNKKTNSGNIVGSDPFRNVVRLPVLIIHFSTKCNAQTGYRTGV